MVTTKSGYKAKGLGIDFGITVGMEKVGILPDLQTEYGPGYDRATNLQVGADDSGWIRQTINGVQTIRPNFRAYAQFGPKVDGRQIYWWDGQFRPYVASNYNPLKDFYRTGSSDIVNFAFGNSGEKGSYRFSYTRNDYKGIQIGGKQKKNSFTLTSTYRITNKLSVDLSANYINEYVHNRPYLQSRITENYGGFFSPVDKMSVYFDKYKTTKGYKYVTAANRSRDTAEALKYNIRAYDFLDFIWNQLENSYDETTNRFIGGLTVNYSIIKGLNLRVRGGSDFTSYTLENKKKSEYPLVYGNSGEYQTAANTYLITYGDFLLGYSVKLNSKFNFNASVGYQVRKEESKNSSVSTQGGLTQINWFSMNASKDQLSSSSSRSYLLKDGLFGVIGFDYNDFLFFEATARREHTSTLAPDRNTFFYPGASLAFEYTRLLKKSNILDYGKLRVSYGENGNPPPPYRANTLYNAYSISGVPAASPSNPYGNDYLRNERKKEFEVGMENRFFKGRLGIDLTWYKNTVVDQILNFSLPATTGATSQIQNVGTLKNHGFEVSLSGTPILTRNFRWDVRINGAKTVNKLASLNSDNKTLKHTNYDNGSLEIQSKVGESIYDIFVYNRATDNAGNNIVDSTTGLYVIDFSSLAKVGNLLPKLSGGFINTFSYKDISLNVVIDYRFGGQVVSLASLYATGAGAFENSLAGRDASHGGLAYYVDADGKYILANGNTTGPNGEKVYHDGMILKGVNANGKTNSTIVDAPNYYLSSFSWGSWPGSGSYTSYNDAVFDNSYIKFREVSLSYFLPQKLVSKIKAQRLSLSLYGRNLFYLYKTLPNYDPEEGAGTQLINSSLTGGSTAQSRSYGISLRVTF